jgi:hypothetical protein
MISIPFVFVGSEDEFRALNPTRTWGQWTATAIGETIIGVFLTNNPNIRAHLHEKLTFLPSSGARKLSLEHRSALAVSGINTEDGHTLHDALERVHGHCGVDFLHPDRF